MPFRFGELITTRMPEDQAGLRVVRSRIIYTAEEPKDYWAERGYSYYDGI